MTGEIVFEVTKQVIFFFVQGVFKFFSLLFFADFF